MKKVKETICKLLEKIPTSILVVLLILEVVASINLISFKVDYFKKYENKYDFQFEERIVDENYSYLIDKNNGVMYLKFQTNSGYGSCALSVLLNPDGTPKKWEGYE